jgi:hypothetical protein
MAFQERKNLIIPTALLVAILVLSGCLTSQKMNAFVEEQYNNKLPGPDKKKNSAITVTSAIPFTPEKSISVTTQKTSKVLPLILYWHYDYRHTCTLNPAIAVNSFTNTVYQQSTKLNQKLNGQQLELTVEQVPNAFAIVDKAGILLFLIHWDKIFVQPDFRDLIVSYKVLQNGNVIKSGKLTMKNSEQDQGIRFFQSWKSATAEYLVQYNANIINMTKTFVNNLLQEL